MSTDLIARLITAPARPRDAVPALSPQQRRERILAVQATLEAMPDKKGPEDYVTRHHFAPGQYAREIELPKDGIVVGKIHRHAHVNVVSKGRVWVYTEGEGAVEIVAPATFISSPGTKRVVYAVEAAVWTTVHVTESTDLATIENEIIARDFDQLALPAPIEGEFTEVTE